MTLTAAFGRPFRYQVAAFRLRLQQLAPTVKWDDLWQEQHDRASMVAGAVKADLLADLAAAVDKAISQGTGLEEFRRDFRKIVQDRGWHGWTGEGTKKGEAWRTRVIYRTNMATSYAAGRWAQLVEAGYRYIIYHHGNSVEPREQHLAWDGLILDMENAEHRRWLAVHAPPNGWGCSCYLSGARTIAQAIRLGGKPGVKLDPDWARPDPRTGAPKGIDKGWAYAPGASATDAIIPLAAKLPRLPAEIGAAMFHTIAPADLAALVREFGAFLDKSLSSRVERNFIVIGALKPSWVTAAEAAGIRPETAEIAVTDRHILHTFRGTSHVSAPTRPSPQLAKVSPVDLAWYRDLPRHLRNPKAVLLDQTGKEPVFVLVYDLPGSTAKLVVEINTPVKKAGGVLNVVQSGRLVLPNDLRSDVARGLTVIEGSM